MSATEWRAPDHEHFSRRIAIFSASRRALEGDGLVRLQHDIDAAPRLVVDQPPAVPAAGRVLGMAEFLRAEPAAALTSVRVADIARAR